jgi:hypothetical protein
MSVINLWGFFSRGCEVQYLSVIQEHRESPMQNRTAFGAEIYLLAKSLKQKKGDSPSVRRGARYCRPDLI